jgi:hypothetical protein
MVGNRVVDMSENWFWSVLPEDLSLAASQRSRLSLVHFDIFCTNTAIYPPSGAI